MDQSTISSVLKISFTFFLLLNFLTSAQTLNFSSFEDTPDNYGWKYATNSVLPVHTVNDGMLIQNTIGLTNIYGFYYLERGSTVVAKSDWKVNISVKVDSVELPTSGFFINVVQNNLLYSIRITSDEIYLLDQNDNEYIIIENDNTEFQDFEISGIYNSGMLITVDGIDLGEALPVPIENFSFNIGYDLAFGDGTSKDSVNAHAEITSFKFMQNVDPLLVAFYPFNGNAQDESTFDNNGLVQGATLTTNRNDIRNQAYLFDGVDDNIVIPYSVETNFDGSTDDYAFSLWVKGDSTSFPDCRILSKWNENLKYPYMISIQASSNKCNSIIYDTYTTNRVKFGRIWDDNWHHIVTVVDNSNKKMFAYLDGEKIDSSETTLEFSTNSQQPIYIGGTSTYHNLPRFMKGAIDDIKIFNYALDENDVTRLYYEDKEIVADFTSDTTYGSTPLTVKFFNTSISLDTLEEINSWRWDFDNDGTIDSEEKNPTWIYSEPGIYSVKLVVSNGTSTKAVFKKNYIAALSQQPQITSVKDVPNDQGRWVEISFLKSSLDAELLDSNKSYGPEIYSVELFDDNKWITVNSSVAYNKLLYHILIPTLKDSTDKSMGISDFRVIAGMSEGNFISNISHGYSVDNIFPSIPNNIEFMIDDDGFLRINWNYKLDDDFDHFNIYRNSENIFDDSLDPIVKLNTNEYVEKILQNENVLYYSITSVDRSGNESDFAISAKLLLTDIEENDKNLPELFSLNQNYPNPFNSDTKIKYSIGKNEKGVSSSALVNLVIYDILGKEVKTLVDRKQNPGYYEIEWNASNYQSGVYFYKLTAGQFVQTKKMILMK